MKILICGAKVTNIPLKVEVPYICFACQADKSDDWKMLFEFYHEERHELPAKPFPFDLVDVLSLARRFQQAHAGRLSNCFFVKLLEMSKDNRTVEGDDPLIRLIDPHGILSQQEEVKLN